MHWKTDALFNGAANAKGRLSEPTDLEGRLIGHYDWKWLCTPVWPFGRAGEGRPPPPFFPVDSQPGLLVALLMGLQHALAMVGGLVTAPLILYRSTVPAGEHDPALEQYFVSAALITSGISSFLQVLRVSIRVPFGFLGGRLFLGTSMITMMGTSFTFVPAAQVAITTMINEGNTWPEAFGRILGTFLVASLLELFLAFIPPRQLSKIAPPIITGLGIALPGLDLIGAGLKQWGGGSACGNNSMGGLGAEIQECFNANGDPYPADYCYTKKPQTLCDGNGSVMLPFGSPQYVGIGFSVFACIIVIELFGSPSMRNMQVVIGLIVGVVVAAFASIGGDAFITGNNVAAAPAATFLWATTFPLGFYAPALLPLLVAYLVATVETMGDITATAEASELDAVGPDLYERMQGGILGNAISSIFSILGTSLPNVAFAQNNGVIALTRVASRQVGLFAAGWLLFMGVFGKIAGCIVAIPNCVLGGMTTFLFGLVTVSGVKILASMPGGIGRRERFILAVSLGLGLGVTLVPGWANDHLWPKTDSMSAALGGFRDAIIFTVSTGYCVGVLLALFLNLVLPRDAEAKGPRHSSVPELDTTHHDSDENEASSSGHGKRALYAAYQQAQSAGGTGMQQGVFGHS